MKTTVYLLRHAETNMNNTGEYNVKEDSQIWNEKNILSVEGELSSLKLSKYKELQDVDIIYSSHYSRAMGTAKYIAHNNNLKLNIEEDLQERIFGYKNWKDFDPKFYKKQFDNWDYKYKQGDSLNEVNLRMTNIIAKIVKDNIGKKIVIVTHGTAILTYLKNFFEIRYNLDTKRCDFYYKDKFVFDNKFSSSNLFKMTFNQNLNITDFKYLDIDIDKKN